VLWYDNLGSLYHTQAMSKGLIDSRDLVYFGMCDGLLLICSKRRSWGAASGNIIDVRRSRNHTLVGSKSALCDWLLLAIGILIRRACQCYGVQLVFFGNRLTEEKRYTIKAPTKSLCAISMITSISRYPGRRFEPRIQAVSEVGREIPRGIQESILIT